jgi:hypothetical protein
MIIAFYPGGCGNRYLQYLLGNDWTQYHRSYDNVSFQLFDHRYLLTPIPTNTFQKYILTHSMNSKQINQAFPDQPVVFIKTNLQQSLRREWMLHGHERFLKKKDTTDISRLDHYYAIKDESWPDINNVDMLDSLPDYILEEVNADYLRVSNPVGVISNITLEYASKIESAYENIQWHLDYYKNYPEDFSNATTIIDIEYSNTNFAQVVKNELNLYSSEVFDKVWDKIHEQ